MRAIQKLNKYQKDLADWHHKKSKGNTPIHKPTRIEYGLQSRDENMIAERIESDLERKADSQ